MKLKFNSVTEKYKWVIDHWEEYDNETMAEILGTTVNVIGQMAHRIRLSGIRLTRKNTKKWKNPLSKNRVNWASINNK